MDKDQLTALPNYALIKLPRAYTSSLTSEKEKYATASSGILVNFTITRSDKDNILPEDLLDIYNQYIDKTVYFTPFQDGDTIKIKDTEYVFIPVSELRGGLNYA